MATTSATTSSNSVTTNPVSVASSSSAGAAGGSVINVSSLVSQLVAATQAPQQALIDGQTQAVTAQVSALGTLKGALSTFQSSLSALSTPSAFNVETATSSNTKVLTAVTGSGAVGGTYNVTITSLASAQQLLSGAFPGAGASSVGTGTLTLTVGGKSFNVTIDNTNGTLAGIAAAINSANDNSGVSASVIQGTDGAHLLLTSAQTGAANTIAVAESDGGGALAALTYGAGNLSHYHQNAAAADAVFNVAGVDYTSASNTVSNALSGVTLTLLAPTGSDSQGNGIPATLTVGSDSSTVQQNIAAFVSAYNTLHSALAGLGSFDATTKTAGPMLGNPVLTGTQNQLQRALYSFVGSSSYNSLASIGITTSSDGSLAVDANKLQTALASNFNAVRQLFSSSQGIATQLNTQITQALASGGTIDSYAQSLTKQENALTQRTDDLNNQMAQLTASLTQQYAALNTLLSSLQTTSSYLTQAFAALPTVQGKANA